MRHPAAGQQPVERKQMLKEDTTRAAGNSLVLGLWKNQCKHQSSGQTGKKLFTSKYLRFETFLKTSLFVFLGGESWSCAVPTVSCRQ